MEEKHDYNTNFVSMQLKGGVAFRNMFNHVLGYHVVPQLRFSFAASFDPQIPSSSFIETNIGTENILALGLDIPAYFMAIFGERFGFTAGANLNFNLWNSGFSLKEFQIVDGENTAVELLDYKERIFVPAWRVGIIYDAWEYNVLWEVFYQRDLINRAKTEGVDLRYNSVNFTAKVFF